MKTTSFLLFTVLFLSKISFPQITDDFSDGDFLSNPQWKGDTTKFEITASGQLHLRSDGADTSTLVTSNSLILNTEWNFWVKLSFNTSANNYARIYLASDAEDITSPVNGYYLKIGGSDDSLWLIRQNGETMSTLVKGRYSFLGNSVNTLRIKVVHDGSGLWKIYTDPLGGTNFREEGTAADTLISYSGWFGVYCKYTSSNSTKFYFDDFYIGPVVKDTVPPLISSLRILDNRRIRILFSECTDPLFSEDPNNYRTRKGEIPCSSIQDSVDARKITLTFLAPFEEKYPDTLTVFNCHDTEGNISGQLSAPFSFYIPETFDVVMDEIMSDPEPSMGLPENEYVELFNRTGFPICLENWRFEWSTGMKIFPDISIAPSGYLILCKDTLLNVFGPAIALFTSSSTLPNEGSGLILKNENGKMIHAVTYSKSWIQDPVKAEGGWSLEMINPLNPCGCGENWSACTYPMGGTPGTVNSVNGPVPDNIIPYIIRAYPENNNMVIVIFSEPMDSVSLQNKGSWLLLPGNESPDSLIAISPGFSEVRMHFATEFEKGAAYEFKLKKGPTDCAGNPADTSKIIRIALPDPASPQDIVINEVLFNPLPGGSRFTELYNISNKVLDLNELAISGFDSASATVVDKTPITHQSFLFFPGDFIVLTENPGDIQAKYYTPDPDAFLKMEAFPEMNDHYGNLLLVKKYDTGIIDNIFYSESRQFQLLANAEGVSLERINPSGFSLDQMNWHSAAESSGFATPGYMNSQYYIDQPGNSVLSITNPVFSPDNDGRDDFLGISLHPDSPGYLANIIIFDSDGRLVRTLARNRLLSSGDTINWDGTDGHHKKAPIGIYIICAELFQTGGKKSLVKQAIVLAGQF